MNEPLPAIHRAGALARRFEELLKDSGSDEQFLRDVARHSAGSSESPWEALAAIDQLYRRGKMGAQLFRAARIGIERRALGFHDAGAEGTRTAEVTPLRSVPVRASRTAGSHQVRAEADPRHAAAGNDQRPSRLEQELHQARIEQALRQARAEQELRQLRDDLDKARREADTYLKRLEQLGWPAQPAASISTPTLVAPAGTPGRALISLVTPPIDAALEGQDEASTPGTVLAPIRWREGIDWISARSPRLDGRRSLWMLRLLLLAGGLLALSRLPTLEPSRGADQPLTPIAAVTAPAGASAPIVATVEPKPGVVALAADRYVVDAGERTALLDVRRSDGADGEVSVQWRVGAASARHGRDYAGAMRGKVVLPAGVTQAQIAIPVLRNPERLHTEFVDVQLAMVAGGATLGELRRATVFLMPSNRIAAR